MFAVRIQNEQQFNHIVNFNQSKGFKMIVGESATYHVNRNCISLGANFCGFSEWLSPVSFDKYIISFEQFENARLSLLN